MVPDALNPGSHALDKSDIDLKLGHYLREHKYLPDAIELFLCELRSGEDHQQFVSKLDLHRSINAFYKLTHIPLDDVEYLMRDRSESPGELDVDDQNRFVQQALGIVKSKIQTMYLLKDKLSNDDAAEYEKILAYYFRDLLLDGEVDRLPGYAKRIGFFKEGDSWKTHQGKLEYLIKTTRTELQSLYKSDILNQPRVELKTDEGNGR